MIPPIPILSDYGISPDRGFLPIELPLLVLPDPYFSRWEIIVENLQALILSNRLRGIIEGMPILSTSRLQHPAEWRRAYILLSFMTHAYIWGGDKPEEVGLYPMAKDQANTTCREFRSLFLYHSSKYASTLNYRRWPHTRESVSGTLNSSFPMSPWTVSTTWQHS